MNKITIKSMLWCMAFSLSFVIAHAAPPVAPGAIREQSQKAQEYYELEKRMEKTSDKEKDEKGVIDETEPKQTKVPQSTKKIHVKKIVTDPSDILTSQEIKEITAPYEGQDITITQLFALIEKINQRYKDKSYLSAKAVLPPQKVEGGVVRIRLIESRIGDVTLENNESTRDAYITDRIAIDKGELVKLDLLESELFYFNSINDVKIRAVLKPGNEFATTDYFLQVEEPLHYYTRVYADNSGNEDTGRERIGVNFVNNSLTGNRDVFTAGADATKGVKSGFASYNIPIGRRGTRLGVSADYSEVKVVEGPFESLNIEGASYNIGGFLSHPFMVKKRFLLNAFAGLNLKNSYTEFDEVKVFDTDVGTASFGVDFQHYGEWGPLYSRHVVTVSDEGFLGADKRFTKYNGELSKIVGINKNVTALFRVSGQLSDADLLPSSEQFLVGGISTVRGYAPGYLSGDDGYFTSVEINFPLLTALQSAENSYGDKLRGKIFLDHGGAFSFKGNNAGVDSSDFITSGGIGINMNFSESVSAQLNLGIPINDRTDTPDDFMVHFYISFLAF